MGSQFNQPITKIGRFYNSHGNPTNARDEDRMLWYSVKCTFWTDDFSKLKILGPGIPCCPRCQSPGYQAPFIDWMMGALDYEKKGEKGYFNFIKSIKETCTKVSVSEAWKQYQEMHSGKLIIDGAIGELIKLEQIEQMQKRNPEENK